MAIYLGSQMVGINSHTNIEHNINTNITVEPLSVTKNGTYTTSSDRAYNPVIVNADPTLNLVTLRPDAELIQNYTRDYKLVADDQIVLPEYSTSNKALQTTKNLSPTITLSYDDYNYYILQRLLLIPEYNIDTLGKGRVEYEYCSSIMEMIEIPSNTLKSIDGSTTYTNRYCPIVQQNYYCNFYWSSATSISPYFSSTYGIIPVPTAPTLSNATLTIKTPAINIRGHTTYLNSTYYNALTDIRMQYVIEVYCAPKNNLNIDGWGNLHQTLKIIDCINNNNCRLI